MNALLYFWQILAECYIECSIVFPVILKLQLWQNRYIDSMKHLANYIIRAPNPLNSNGE